MEENEKRIVGDNLCESLTAFCFWRVHDNLCSPDECEWCPVMCVYKMADAYSELARLKQLPWYNT